MRMSASEPSVISPSRALNVTLPTRNWSNHWLAMVTVSGFAPPLSNRRVGSSPPMRMSEATSENCPPCRLSSASTLPRMSNAGRSGALLAPGRPSSVNLSATSPACPICSLPSALNRAPALALNRASSSITRLFPAAKSMVPASSTDTRELDST